MDNNCPICRLLVGKKPGSGKICRACYETQGVVDAYQWFSIVRSLHKSALLFIYGYPFLALLGPIVTWFVTGFSWNGFAIQFTCWGMWIFNVFYLYPKMNIPRTLVARCVRLELAKDELFLAKISGEPLRRD
jgi:hypothetical protein